MLDRKNRSRLLAMVLVGLMVLSFAAPAFAATDTLYATTGLNVRRGPGTNYSVIGVLAKGQAVTRVGASGNWTKIAWDGGVAYAYTQYLTSVGSGGSGSVGTTENRELIYGSYVYADAGISNKTIGTLTRGQIVTILGWSGSWGRISYNGRAGYIHKSYLSAPLGGGSGSGGNTAYVTMSAVRDTTFYTSASSNATRYGVISRNELVIRVGTSGTAWTQIEYGGLLGFVRTADLKSVPAGMDATKFVSKNTTHYAKARVSCYNIPYNTSSSNLAGYLSRNERVVLLASDGTWGKILVEGKLIYYVRITDLTSSSGGDNGGGIANPGGSTAWKYLRAGDRMKLVESIYIFNNPRMRDADMIKESGRPVILIKGEYTIRYQSYDRTNGAYEVQVFDGGTLVYDGVYIPNESTDYPTDTRSSYYKNSGKLFYGDRVKLTQNWWFFSTSSLINSQRILDGSGNPVILDRSTVLYYEATAGNAYRVRTSWGEVGYLPASYVKKY